MKMSCNNKEYESTLVSKNINLSDRRTSIRLEPQTWSGIQEIATREKCTVHDLCALIERCKDRNSSLTSAVREFVMLYFRAAATEEGHRAAGHGCLKKMMERAKIVQYDPDIMSGHITEAHVDGLEENPLEN